MRGYICIYLNASMILNLKTFSDWWTQQHAFAINVNHLNIPVDRINWQPSVIRSWQKKYAGLLLLYVVVTKHIVIWLNPPSDATHPPRWRCQDLELQYS